MAALVQGVVAALEPTLAKHTISCALPEEPVIIDGDAMRLEQVVENVLHNAIKYSPGGGSVVARVEPRRGQVCLSVMDQGIGIPPDALDQVFMRFYRARNVAPQQIAGFGIGLTVVAEIVQLHGGTVHVESTEGVGSTFTICLPAHASATGGASAKP
jgi:signal transduction histidine kinase